MTTEVSPNLVETLNQNTTGNAGTVTNGVYTTGSYSKPAWITAIDYSILSGTVPTWNQNTTGSSGSCTGNAATASTVATINGLISAGSNITLTGSGTSVSPYSIAGQAPLTYTASTGLTLTGTAFSIGSSVVTLTGTQSLTNKTINYPTLNYPSIYDASMTDGLTLSSGAAETFVYDNGNSGTSKAIAWDNGNNQKVLITGAVALTFTAPTNPGKFTIIIKQDSSGHAYTLPTIKWVGGLAPTLSSTANAIDILTVLYDGSAYYGSFGGGFA